MKPRQKRAIAHGETFNSRVHFDRRIKERRRRMETHVTFPKGKAFEVSGGFADIKTRREMGYAGKDELGGKGIMTYEDLRKGERRMAAKPNQRIRDTISRLDLKILEAQLRLDYVRWIPPSSEAPPMHHMSVEEFESYQEARDHSGPTPSQEREERELRKKLSILNARKKGLLKLLRPI